MEIREARYVLSPLGEALMTLGLSRVPWSTVYYGVISGASIATGSSNFDRVTTLTVLGSSLGVT